MPTRQTLLVDINRKIGKILSMKSWHNDLNFIPVDETAIRAFDALLDYIEMLQSQVKGLEEEIRKIR